MWPGGWAAAIFIAVLVAAFLLWLIIRRFVRWIKHRAVIARTARLTRRDIMQQIDTCIRMRIVDPEDAELKSEFYFLVGILRRKARS